MRSIATRASAPYAPRVFAWQNLGPRDASWPASAPCACERPPFPWRESGRRRDGPSRARSRSLVRSNARHAFLRARDGFPRVRTHLPASTATCLALCRVVLVPASPSRAFRPRDELACGQLHLLCHTWHSNATCSDSMHTVREAQRQLPPVIARGAAASRHSTFCDELARKTNQQTQRGIRFLFWIAYVRPESHYARAIRSHGLDRNVVTDENAKARHSVISQREFDPDGTAAGSLVAASSSTRDKKLNGALGS